MNQTETIGALAKSLAKAQGEIENASKDSENTFFKNAAGKNTKYASLAEALTAIRPVFSRHGLSLIQVPCLTEKGFVLMTRIMHESGEWIEGDYPIEPTKKDPQGFGGAITYARRYSAMAFAGIAPEDDDANDASGKTGTKEAAKAVAEKKVETIKSEPKTALAEAFGSRAQFTVKIKNATRAQLTTGIKQLYTAFLDKSGKLTADAMLAEGLAELHAEVHEKLDREGAAILCAYLYDRLFQEEGEPAEPEIRELWGQMTSIESTVKTFGYLKELLTRQFGAALAEEDYRKTLKKHGVDKSNQFMGDLKTARQAAKDLWLIIDAENKRRDMEITDDDAPM